MPIQTIIVSPGETVYIPKNATIIGVDKTETADVDSDCIDLDVAPFSCYAFEIASAYDNGSQTKNYEIVKATGIEQKGIFYPFANPVQFHATSSTFQQGLVEADADAIIDAINSLDAIKAGIKIQCRTAIIANNRGAYALIVFKTPSTLGDTMKIRVVATINNAGPGFNNLYFTSDAIPYSALTEDPYNITDTICPCTSSTSS